MRKELLLLVFGISVAMAGCTSGVGDVEVLVSDQPNEIGNFFYLNTTFSEARIYEGENENAARVVDLDGVTVDLTEVKGTTAASLLNTTLPAGNYTKIELEVESAVGDAAGSSNNSIHVPAGKLMLTKPFKVVPDETTRFVFDIKVVERGRSGYNLLPVISESGVAGKDVEMVRQARPEEPAVPGQDE